MNHRKLFFNLIVLFTLPLLGLWLSLAGLARVAQAAPAPVALVESSGLALPPALPPTSTFLFPNSVAENQITGTTVGTFTTTDFDEGQTFTYTFTDTGSFPDNAFFSIVSDTLKTNAMFNFEVTPSYTISVLTTDSGDENLVTTFTINITDVNEAPTDINLSSTIVAENQITGTTVGTFTTTGDPDIGDSHTYTFTGSFPDNAFFSIVSDTLKTDAMFNFEVTPSYTIQVQTDDGVGGAFTKAFTIAVADVNEAPTDINSSSTIVAENQITGTTVGTFTTTDPDIGQTHSYTFTGSFPDNAFFSIVSDTLKTNAMFNFEADNSYTIKVQTDDGAGGVLAKEFTITITDVNEAPTNINLSSTIIAENQITGTTVGTFTTTGDPDIGDSHTYSLVDTGSFPDNSSFTIVGNALRTAAVFDFVTKSSYTIKVRTTDGGSLFFEEQFTISVIDVLPTITVAKTANPTSIPETGANVTFTIRVTNTSQEKASLFLFSDTDFDLDTHCPDWPNKLIAASLTYTCVFTEFIFGDFGSPNHVNTASATVKDNENHNDNDLDVETVTFTDVQPNITVTKTANPSSIVEPGGNVTFTVLVTNNSTEAATLVSLTDNVFGNLNGQGTCAINGTIAPNGGTYSCSFTQLISGGPGTNHVDTVTAQVSDDDTNSMSANDNATVSITPIIKVYLPLILQPGTGLYVFNDDTGGGATFTVLGTSVSCTVPNNTTRFCGSFPPGTYDVQVTSACGSNTFSKTYPTGPQTTRVFCN